MALSREDHRARTKAINQIFLDRNHQVSVSMKLMRLAAYNFLRLKR